VTGTAHPPVARRPRRGRWHLPASAAALSPLGML